MYNCFLNNSIILFISERKEVLLVTGYPGYPGYPFGFQSQVEIVDTNVQPKQCTTVQNFPTELEHAMGGLINNQLVICGGKIDSDRTNQCQRLGNNGQWSTIGAGLKVARSYAGAATVKIQGEDFLWITGGRDSSVNRLKSTELLSSIGSVTVGKDLPEARSSHCMLVINNHVMVIGGYPSSDVGRSVIIFDSSNDFSHEDGPSLINKRGSHACSTMASPAHEGRTVAVVAGGKEDGQWTMAGGYGDGGDTAEILDYTMPGSTWQLSE